MPETKFPTTSAAQHEAIRQTLFSEGRQFSPKIAIAVLVAALLVAIGAYKVYENEHFKSYRVSIVSYHSTWQDQLILQIVDYSRANENIDLTVCQTQHSSAAQVAAVDSIAEVGTDVIIITPYVSQELDAALERAQRKGIKIVTVDRSTRIYDAYVTGNQHEMGYLAGMRIVQQLKGKGTILEVWGEKNNENSERRHAGLVAAINSSPDVKIIGEVMGGWYGEPTEKAIDALPADFPEPDYVFAHNDGMADAARVAFARRGMHPRIIGIDARSDYGFQLVRGGVFDASVRYRPEGDIVTNITDSILHDLNPNRRTVYSCDLVTPENAAYIANHVQYETELKKLQAKIHQANLQLKKENEMHRFVQFAGAIFFLFLIGFLVYMIILYNRRQRALFQFTEALEETDGRFYDLKEERDLLQAVVKYSIGFPEGSFPQQICAEIEAGLGKAEVTPAVLAQNLEVSMQELTEIIELDFHLKPAVLIELIRSVAASRLVHGGKATVAEAAKQVGYGSTAEFIKIYQKVFSNSPYERFVQ